MNFLLFVVALSPGGDRSAEPTRQDATRAFRSSPKLMSGDLQALQMGLR
jgi:hypothetical protein